MLVRTATKDHAGPHWKRTRGGRDRVVVLSWRVSSTSASFQILEVYCVRTSREPLAPAYVSKNSCMVSVAGWPPLYCCFGTFVPVLLPAPPPDFGAPQLFFLAIEYSFGLNMHSMISPPRSMLMIWAFGRVSPPARLGDGAIVSEAGRGADGGLLWSGTAAWSSAGVVSHAGSGSHGAGSPSHAPGAVSSRSAFVALPGAYPPADDARAAAPSTVAS